MSSTSPVWLITGCSSGFGSALTLLALKSGHKVIATSRNPSKNPELVTQVEKLGGTWLALDICSPETELAKTIEKATSIHGRIDILVNNAGYGLLGALECFSDEECRAQFETNFFGPLNLCRLVVPSMRARRSGTIVNISSTAGIEAQPSRSMYSGSKYALEAMSEALYHEMKPFDVRVLIVEPGAFGSNMPDACVVPKKELPRDYDGTATEMVVSAVKNMQGGKAPGDVEKGVKAIFDVVMRSGQAEGMEEFLRLPLGKDGSARWTVKLDDLRRNLEGTERIWSMTDKDP